jgi:hypothetical protein
MPSMFQAPCNEVCAAEPEYGVSRETSACSEHVSRGWFNMLRKLSLMLKTGGVAKTQPSTNASSQATDQAFALARPTQARAERVHSEGGLYKASRRLRPRAALETLEQVDSPRVVQRGQMWTVRTVEQCIEARRRWNPPGWWHQL